MPIEAIIWTVAIVGALIIACIIGLIALTVLMEALGESDDHFDTFENFKRD